LKKNIKNIALEMRPKTIDDVFGNPDIKKIILSKTASTMPKAILIEGEPGSGKTTIARIILKTVGCAKECLKEFNMGTQGGIETARKVEKQINFMPGIGRSNGWLFDESHKANANTISGLLKPLEDAPDFNYFIFCTSDKSGFLKKFTGEERKAFLRRCLELRVNKIDDTDGYNMIINALTRFDVPEEQLPDTVIDKILDISNGVPANMYKNLETIIGLNTPEEMISYLNNTPNDEEQVSEDIKKLCQSMLNKNWTECAKQLIVMKKNKVDAESVRFPIMGYMAAVVLNETDNKKIARAHACIEQLKHPMHDSRIYALITAVRYVCMLG